MPTERGGLIAVAAATEDEWAVVREVRLAALADDPEAFCAVLAVERQHGEDDWRRRLSRPEVTTLLARQDDEVVGLVTVEAQDDGSADIVSFWIRPAARGRGAGSALLEAAIDLARRGGHTRATLEVGDHNVAAQRLYARHGFVPTGHTSTMPPPKEHVTEHQLALDL